MTQDKKKQQKEDRNKNAIAKLKEEKEMEKPTNRFLNEKTDDGKLKYQSAKRIWDDALLGFGEVIEITRIINVKINSIVYDVSQMKRAKKEMIEGNKITFTDEHGRIMTRDEVRSKYLLHKNSPYKTIQEIRKLIIEAFLPRVCVDGMDFDKADNFLTKIDNKITELGFDLWDTDMKLILP